ncbi:MAG: hypothetical protein ABEJ02_02435 [Candidatus Paceibacteria bacterium]
MSRKKYKKQHSREYSIFRLGIFYDVISEKLDRLIDFSTEDFCAIFRGEGLVSMYYPEGFRKRLAQAVAKGCQDKQAMRGNFDNMIEIFRELRPYYEKNKKVEDLDELKKFASKYGDLWSYITISFVIPNLPDVDQSLSKKALEARERTQEYNEAPEEVISKFLVKRYPDLENRARFIRRQEVYQEEDSVNIKKRVSNRKSGFVFHKNELYSDKSIKEVLRDLNIKLEKVDQ